MNTSVVHVARERGNKILLLPLEEDGSLLFSTLVEFFSDARGLMYYNQMDTICGVRLENGKFYPPKTKTKTVFYCVFLEEDIVYVAERRGAYITELPLEKDGSLLYSTLAKFFPNARGLMYYNTQTNRIHGVQLARGRFYPSFKNCGSTIFYCDEFIDCSAQDAEKSTNEANLNEEYLSTTCVKPVLDHDKDGEINENGSLSKDFPIMKNEIDEKKLVVDTNKKLPPINYHTPSHERPHQCKICGYCFLRRDHLTRHASVHSGEKPFQCSICSVKYTRSSSLKNHIDRWHKTAQFGGKNPSETASNSEITMQMKNNALA